MKNVLVDAYNLELPHGTGIKTYGMTLIRALRALNIDVSLLYSRNVGKSRSPLLNELLFRDSMFFPPERDRMLLRRRLVKTALGMSEPMVRIPDTNLIHGKRGEYEMGAERFTARQCFEDAMNIHYRIRRELTLSGEHRFDIFHCTYPLPLKVRGAKRVTTIHDIIPILFPHMTLDRKDEFFYRHQRVIKDSDLVVTVSEASKRDLVKVFNVPEEKVCVTYQPANLEDVGPEEEESATAFLSRNKLQAGKYLLFVGAIEPKKNVKAIIDAYAWLDTDVKLVLAGKRAWMWESQIGHIESVFGKTWPQRIKLLDYLSYNELRYVMKNAYALLFPSIYEGFGLPPLEAMQMGVPVITSNTSSLPEVCGDAALYTDPEDVVGFAGQIEKLLSSESLRRSMVAAGLEQAKTFSPERYAERLNAAYNSIL